jgi:hypothetical protein
MDVQPALVEDALADFRTWHPTVDLTAGDVRWEYIACGTGDETLLLNGGMRVAETAFAYIELFEPYYRLTVPTYPPLRSMDELTDGIGAILDAEGAGEVLVLGQSYGGQVAPKNRPRATACLYPKAGLAGRESDRVPEERAERD